MSGLVRNLVDQVLKNMSEEERAQQVNYVTDRMVEKMDNRERVALLMAIIDRVMSHLSPDERASLTGQLARHLGDSATPAAEAEEEYTGEEIPVTGGGVGGDRAASPAQADITYRGVEAPATGGAESPATLAPEGNPNTAGATPAREV